MEGSISRALVMAVSSLDSDGSRGGMPTVTQWSGWLGEVKDGGSIGWSVDSR